MYDDYSKLFERCLLDRKYFSEGLYGLSLKPDAHILDLGCGSGGSTKIISECYPEAIIIGMDCSKEALDYAISKVECERINFIYGDARSIPFSDGMFDCCVSRMMLDITGDSDPYLREMSRILRNGGKLLIYGNVRTTALGPALPRHTLKMLSAYERYLRLSKRQGFDVAYIKSFLEEQCDLEVTTRRIIKDTVDPGRDKLIEYYTVDQKDIDSFSKNNLFTRLHLMRENEVLEYEQDLVRMLLDPDVYLSFEQAIIYAVK